jgi:DNA-binding NarL/FixJ family response regulator
MDSRSLFLVDDHPVFRMGLRRVLDAEPDLRVVGTAETGDDALRQLATTPADLILVDLSLPGMSGLELVQALRELQPGRPVLVLSMHNGDLYAARAALAGAIGYVNKEAEPADIVAAVRRALAGDAMKIDRGADLPEGELRLTARERQVFALTGRGFGTRQVAEELGIGIKTVETHKAHIKRKLGVRTATELVREAVAWAVHQS